MALAYSAFRRLPVSLRRLVVRVIAPTYVVGAVVVIRDTSGAVLLLRERHHDGWGLPGGLAQRGEPVLDAAVRETREEVDVEIDPELLGSSTVNIDPMARRVDAVFLYMADGLHPRACEPEVLEVRWFAPEDLPELFEPTADALRSAGVIVADAAN
jgi:ADP-ribose pyrophosphatase YjhB (NUDIX family)